MAKSFDSLLQYIYLRTNKGVDKEHLAYVMWDIRIQTVHRLENICSFKGFISLRKYFRKRNDVSQL